MLFAAIIIPFDSQIVQSLSKVDSGKKAEKPGAHSDRTRTSRVVNLSILRREGIKRKITLIRAGI